MTARLRADGRSRPCRHARRSDAATGSGAPRWRHTIAYRIGRHRQD
ncbi:hypothetical protein BURPS1710b_A1501 [Burkholderia pseudomallei 1710b]|uniref:Uncharacterized protein n=1 Tax=Burkholderia pseudomallei (strain 1710b) TaxID=320372 RepID=Q3JIE4_BURP1|nr:hypothetical protein BURPS1710b_A1501 [Burkholderia pseudomallei 1710b]